jgi:4-carboxymuconolactone decarboxylase
MPNRYEEGLELMKLIAGKDADRIIATLDALAPGYSRTIVEWAFGEVCARPGLDLKTRELLTIASLVAMGTATPQLKLHIGGALNTGCTRTEIVETIVQTSLYAGIPAALNGLAVADEIFASR